MCDRVRKEIQEHGRQHKAVRGLGEVSVHEWDRGERDGRTGTKLDELGRDVLSGEIKEGQSEGVKVEHVFLPGRLCEGVGSGLWFGGFDVSGKDVVLDESEESGEEEGEAEDGYALGIEGCGDVGWVGIRDGRLGFRGGEGGDDDADGDDEYGEDLFEGISGDEFVGG